MTTGSSSDIVTRVKGILPKGWWGTVASYCDSIIGGLADNAAWNYGLIGYAKAQTRIATAYGIFLDFIAYEFLGSSLTRNGASDPTFRSVLQATILQERVTRNGMSSVVSKLTTVAPWIFEPWNTADTGAYSSATFKCGQFGYGVGKGGYGSVNLQAQTFMIVTRTAPSGVPNVSGYGDPAGGYGEGAIEYVGSNTSLSGVTNAIIQQAINITKPVGSTVWLNIGPQPSPQPKRPLIFNANSNSQNLFI